ncbi:MAG: SemiSWEET family sugar transporter [Alphaproteobacteria bacterium]
MILAEIVGFAAVITSTMSLIPQVIKSLKTRSVKDLSLLMLLNLVATSILWLIYGLMINSPSVIGANIILTIFSSWLLYLKIIYD